MSAEAQGARADARAKREAQKAKDKRAAELQKQYGHRKLGFKQTFKRYWQLWAMALPAVIFVAIFNYGPMYGIQLAFREFDFTKGLTGGEWVGFKYFKQFFDSPLFGTLMINTVRISLWTLVMGFIFPIILALLINQIHSSKVKGFVQTITYLPHFISTVVVVSMINLFLKPDVGVLTRALGVIGIHSDNFMGDPNLFTPIYWISEVWQHVGWNSIIYLAALSSVDTALYEAAKIDGAGRLQLIRYVDIPAILPTCGVLLILNMGGVLNVGFEKVFLMQNTLNIDASEVISTYTYKIGLLQSQFSYSTAIGLFNMLINFAFLIIANQVSRKVSNSGIF
ncbi:ABC transporter permease subunit [Bifidobacterium amazonense]|uniref:ABC transporter permease subunit n=1 Tax=Bifidobacterium amazonense TaxID=2809027 RepID=A0ABS9VY04_9BIFI|nr:ABC transporter permease subunit [Bifidobacterium amazonense]MCH9276983.1 ABC transporter permease subunit [Bifidobacterium amazonense]